MKIFQVEDIHAEVIEHILWSLSNRDTETKIDNIVYCVEYEDQKYHVGYWNASPPNMVMAAGYITMDANMRYMKINRAEFEAEDEDEV